MEGNPSNQELSEESSLTEPALIQEVALEAARGAPDEATAEFRRDIAISSLRARLAQARSDIQAIQRAKADLRQAQGL
jgi:hypothetical protein